MERKSNFKCWLPILVVIAAYSEANAQLGFFPGAFWRVAFGAPFAWAFGWAIDSARQAIWRAKAKD